MLSEITELNLQQPWTTAHYSLEPWWKQGSVKTSRASTDVLTKRLPGLDQMKVEAMSPEEAVQLAGLVPLETCQEDTAD